MIALFGLFNRKLAGWKKMTTAEGISLLFPLNPVRKPSQSETPIGKINVTLYSAGMPGTNFSAILSIRDFEPKWAATAADYFADWRAEFTRTMEVCQVDMKQCREEMHESGTPRCDLLFTNEAETSYTRVSLLSKGTRLVILFAVGKLEEVAGPACSECFRSIRL